MRRFFTALIFSVWHFVAYSGKDETDYNFIKIQKELMEEQRARHKLIEVLDEI